MRRLLHPRVWLALLFLGALIVAAYLRYIVTWAPIPSFAISLLTLLVYAFDKRAAQNGARRISEAGAQGHRAGLVPHELPFTAHEPRSGR